ncbi:MAG TPA: M50 family metallopeptidase [Streptosporangiaceae bacterium]|nr:M50 family metallopeptidase [Streptosporangiaceae bacterium]
MTNVHATSLGQFWHLVISAEPLPPRILVLATGLAALILVGWRRAWPVSRTVVTIAHEGGHALVALATGRRLAGVRVHRSTAGLTVSAGKPYGPGIVATAAAGYLAPPLLGLGTAALLAAGHLVAALLLSLVLLAGLAVMVRNAYGILAVLTAAAVVAFVVWRGNSLLQGVFGYAMAWFLLLGGIRPVLELQQSRRRGRAARSDADQLARLTGVPGGAWVALFALVASAALVISALWMVH